MPSDGSIYEKLQYSIQWNTTQQLKTREEAPLRWYATIYTVFKLFDQEWQWNKI